MAKLFLVWNEDRSECVGFKDEVDAKWTVKGGRHPTGLTPSLGATFREYYADEGQKLIRETVEVKK